MSAARDAAERIIKEYPVVKRADAFDVAGALLGVLNDPSLLLPEPEWEQVGWRKDHFDFKTQVGTYHVCRDNGWYWITTPRELAGIEIKPCNSLESGKLACWEHYRNVVKLMFGVK